LTTITVIDRTGRHYAFDADSWHVYASGYAAIEKDGNTEAPVATFPPGYLGVYRTDAYLGASEGTS